MKIEPNHIIRGTVYDPEIIPLVHEAEEYFEMEVDFPVLSAADLYAGKICAALDRQHPRDLFDVDILLRTTGITRELKSALLVYIISHNRPIAELLSPNLQDLKKPFEQEFRYMAREEVILENLEDTRTQLIQTVHNVLSDEDKRFLLSVKSGNPDWSLHPVAHIRDLPAVQWKMYNIRNLPPKKHKFALEKLKIVLEEGPQCFH